MLSCRGLRRSYGGRPAVDDVGFDIAPGRDVRVAGAERAGKTTTISMVRGLLARDAGEVTVAGRPMGPEAVSAWPS